MTHVLRARMSLFLLVLKLKIDACPLALILMNHHERIQPRDEAAIVQHYRTIDLVTI